MFVMVHTSLPALGSAIPANQRHNPRHIPNLLIAGSISHKRRPLQQLTANYGDSAAGGDSVRDQKPPDDRALNSSGPPPSAVENIKTKNDFSTQG